MPVKKSTFVSVCALSHGVTSRLRDESLWHSYSCRARGCISITKEYMPANIPPGTIFLVPGWKSHALPSGPIKSRPFEFLVINNLAKKNDATLFKHNYVV